MLFRSLQQTADIDDLQLLEYDIDDRQALMATGTYTSGCCQRVIGFKTACGLIIGLFFLNGLFDGYTHSIRIIFQSQKASYHQMSMYSFVKYPEIFKFVIAPLVDTYYFRSFGKSKTYLSISSIMIALTCLVVSNYADDLIANNYVALVSCMLIVINSFQAFYFMAATIWIVTLFTGEEEKTRGSLTKPIADSIGKHLLTGLFIPLNSVKWLNNYVYSREHAVSQPCITHRHFFMFAGIGLLTIVGFVTLFVAEKRIELKSKLSFNIILKFSKKLLTNINLMKLTGFFVAFECLHYLVTELISYKVMNAGFSKESAAIVDTCTIPITIVAGILYQRYLRFGHLITAAHYMAAIWLISMLIKYSLAIKLEDDPSWPGAFWVYLLVNSIGALATPLICLLAYLVHISDPRTSSTLIGIMLGICQFAHMVPKSISLFLAKYIDPDIIIITLKMIHFLALISLYKLARYLDTLKAAE